MARRSRQDAIVQDVVTQALRQRTNRLAWIAVALLILAGSAIWSHSHNPADPSQWDGQSVIVERVIDGDTIVVSGQGMDREHVRLRGIDAPELAHDGTPAMHFGERSKTYLADRLKRGTSVTLKFDGTEKRDRFERLLAYVYLDESDCVNVDLVRDGMAYVDRRFKTMLQSTLDQNENTARTKGVGLWNCLDEQDMPPWRQRWLGTVKQRATK